MTIGAILNKVFYRKIDLKKESSQATEVVSLSEGKITTIISSISSLKGYEAVGFYERLCREVRQTDVQGLNERLMDAIYGYIKPIQEELERFEDFKAMQYYRDYPGQEGCSLLCSILWDFKKELELCPISWIMKTNFGEDKLVDFSAGIIDLETWELMGLYAEYANSGQTEEGDSFILELEPERESIRYPDCDAGPYISPTDKITRNGISVDCDTYGTQMGSRAESLYAFYLKDSEQYAIVRHLYYVF